jgi:hypothetical protein
MMKLSRKAASCFAGMFNGCKNTGVILVPESDHLSIGKSECEWDWRETWGELKAKGLIDWREEDVPCHDGRKMINVHLMVTDKGWKFREDDLHKWHAKMDRL